MLKPHPFIWQATLFFIFLSVLAACTVAPCQETPQNRCVPDSLNMQLVNHLGGPTLSVDVQGNYAYVGRSFELEVLDLADKARPQRVGYALVPASDVVVNGNFAFASGRDGLRIIEITQPAQPKVLAFHPSASAPASLAIQAGYVFVAEDYGGFRVIDARQPYQTAQVAFLQLQTRISAIALQNNRAYLATSRGLQVIDISDPTQPILLALGEMNTWINVWINTVAVHNQFIFLGLPDGLTVLERIATDTFRLVASQSMQGGVAGIEVTADSLFVANGTQGLSVIDIASDGKPTLVNKLQLSGDVVNITYEAGYLFAPDSRDHLYIVKSSPGNHLTTIGAYHVPGISQEIVLAGKRVIVLSEIASNVQSNLQVLDITESGAMRDAKQQSLPGVGWQLATNEEDAYLVSGRGEISVVDFVNPADQEELTTIAVVQRANSLDSTSFTNNRLLVTSNQSKLYIFDIANSRAPLEIGSIEVTEQILHDVIVWHDYALIAAGKAGVLIADISHPQNPTIMADVAGIGFANALVANEQSIIIASGKAGVQIINMADPLRPTIASQINIAGEALDVTLQGSIAIVAAGEAGVYLIDIANPKKPVEVGFFDTADFAVAVASDGNFIYVADHFGGVYVFAYTPPKR